MNEDELVAFETDKWQTNLLIERAHLKRYKKGQYMSGKMSIPGKKDKQLG